MGGLDGIWFLRSDKRTYEFAFHVSDNQIRQNVDLILNLINAVSTGKVEFQVTGKPTKSGVGLRWTYNIVGSCP